MHHLIDVVKVVVGFPELSQGRKSLGDNRAKLLIGGFFVLHVHFVPLFHHFYRLFTPRNVVIRVERFDL
jgi:hypothetical protein